MQTLVGMGKSNFPVKRSVTYNHNLTIRVESKLLEEIKKLKEIYNIDTPELMRVALREAVSEALTALDTHSGRAA